MDKNMGIEDRVVRVIIALMIVALYFTGKITGIIGILLGILAIIFLVTSAVGFCPIYTVIKISTIRKK